jgi:dTDP-glucose 4,6-dehydratase
MDYRGRAVLITGAGGFIGSHLAERLVELGADVRAMVHYNSAGRRGWLDDSPLAGEMRVVAGDIRDADGVEQMVRDRDTVFHLAALIGIPYSYDSPMSYVRTNVEGMLNVLQAVRRSNVSSLVHTSTSEVYGTAKYVPIGEDHPLQGQSPYAATKIAADKLAESYFRSFQTPVVTVRPFNVFGPRQSARAVIPTIITQAMTQSSVQLGNLESTRDLNFVANTVEAFVLAGAIPAAIGQTMNIGSGQETSVKELADKIIRLVGRPVAITQKEERLRPPNSEVERLVSDATLAGKLLGWKPQVEFNDGLQRTIDWFREYHGRYRPELYSV